MDPIVTPAPVVVAPVAPDHPAEHAVAAVVEPPKAVVEGAVNLTDEKLDKIIGLLEVNNAHMVRSHEAIAQTLGHLGNVSNTLVETSGHLAEAAAHVGGEAAETVLTVPEVPAEAVDAAVEEVAPEDKKPKQRSRKDVFKRKR